mmetsp:Transcript_13574/g.44331  ORF Transcript_13574/g.44331 Transcript_13574/m.44331 type:complete len:599 (-) Transcript_13574:9597-11393(-)
MIRPDLGFPDFASSVLHALGGRLDVNLDAPLLELGLPSVQLAFLDALLRDTYGISMGDDLLSTSVTVRSIAEHAVNAQRTEADGRHVQYSGPFLLRLSRDSDMAQLFTMAQKICEQRNVQPDDIFTSEYPFSNGHLIISDVSGNIVGAVFTRGFTVEAEHLPDILRASCDDVHAVELLGLCLHEQMHNTGLDSSLMHHVIATAKFVLGAREIVSRGNLHASGDRPQHQPNLNKSKHAFNLHHSSAEIDRMSRTVTVLEPALCTLSTLDINVVRPGRLRQHATSISAESIFIEAMVETVGLVLNAATTADVLRTPFTELGFDSETGVELACVLSRNFSRKISSTAIYDYPTPIALLQSLQHVKNPRTPPVVMQARHVGLQDEHALVGATWRLPALQNTRLDTLRVGESGGDAINMVPSERRYPETTIDDFALTGGCLHGGFMAGAQMFDNAFFNISQGQAIAMDPQQRLLLECGYSSLHSTRTGCRTSLHDHGIFLGIMNVDFSASGGSVYDATGRAISIAAGRIAFFLGMQGPCLSIDTACSSALVAVHCSSSAIRAQECTAALAIAVNLVLAPSNSVAFQRAGMLSHDGRCKTCKAA